MSWLVAPWRLLAYFATPAWLLAVVPIVAIGLWLGARSHGYLRFSSVGLLPRAMTWRVRLAWLPSALFALAGVAFVIALAGPRRGVEHSRVRRDGIGIMAAIDISNSMAALDLSDDESQTRLDIVKEILEQFVLGAGDLPGRPDDAVGLVSFGTYADTRSPLSLDHANLTAAIRALTLTGDEEGATALNDGLALAAVRLADFPTKSKVLILLTDGMDTASETALDDAIAIAKDAGIKVYAIGAGSQKGRARVRVGGEMHVIDVAIDESTLQKIADATGGKYLRASDRKGLASVYATIDKLERTELTQLRFASYREYYWIPTLVALVAMLLASVLRLTWLRRLA